LILKVSGVMGKQCFNCGRDVEYHDHEDIKSKLFCDECKKYLRTDGDDEDEAFNGT
jgi:hypothetical protein